VEPRSLGSSDIADELLLAFDEVLEPLTKLTQLIHSPPYADPSVVLSLGCTDAVSKTFTLFADKVSLPLLTVRSSPCLADLIFSSLSLHSLSFPQHTAPNVLCEEFSFVASLNTGRSRGLVFHGVQVDRDGMVPEDLERVLSSWNEAEQGPKPRVGLDPQVGFRFVWMQADVWLRKPKSSLVLTSYRFAAYVYYPLWAKPHR
jgi:DNA-binding transcriptional MocR family regulator